MAQLNVNARLHVDQPLAAGCTVRFSSGQSHYLTRVMRLKQGSFVGLFNGCDGEWCARLRLVHPCSSEAECLTQTKLQEPAWDIWLLFAPLKKARTDFVVEKATELGVSAILPVRTELTVPKRVASRRLRIVAREAAEQCHGLTVPEIREFDSLRNVLDHWPPDRKLVVCDESLRNEAKPAERVALFNIAGAAQCRPQESNRHSSLGLLIGPEGGFTAGERQWLRSVPYSVEAGLGRRLLRAETAAVAALSLLTL